MVFYKRIYDTILFNNWEKNSCFYRFLLPVVKNSNQLYKNIVHQKCLPRALLNPFNFFLFFINK